MKTCSKAEHDDALIASVVALDWTSTIGQSDSFIRSDRHLERCLECGETGTHVQNLWVRCTNPACIMAVNPVPRVFWQSAGTAGRMCMSWAKRFWKVNGELHAARNNGLDQRTDCRE